MFLHASCLFKNAFSLETHFCRMALWELWHIPLCCQAIAPHWKKPDEINAGCWLLQFHGTPHCHPKCLSPDWDICKLSSPINSCLLWCRMYPSNSESEKLWWNISSSSPVSLLKVRNVAKKKRRRKCDSGWWLMEQKPF